MISSEVVILGLGYIGLPTAALIAKQETTVLGVDINEVVVKTINRGEIHIVEPELGSAVQSAVESGFLKASTKPSKAKVFIVVVPTPFKENFEPDTSYIESSISSIIPYIKEGDLCIIESTSPVGTTEKMINFIYSYRPDLINKIFMAYCPERVLPGNIMYELKNNDRVIGGINKKSTEKAISFYKKYVTGNLHETNSRTAEMCKLVENSSRDVQISFANELSMICDKADINIWELISLANKHPRVNILKPGCGVGGHCIAVDPYFISHDYPEESKIISLAREVNNYKSDWCIEKIQNAKLKFELEHNKKPVIAIMGLSFKPNIDDLRESPAHYIANIITENSNLKSYYVVEPNIKSHDKFKLTHYLEAFNKSDIIVFLVAHNEFKELNADNDKVILDFCGINQT